MYIPQIIFVFCLFGSSYIAGAFSTEKKLWTFLNKDSGTYFPFIGGQINVSMKVPIVSLSDYDHTLGTVRVGYWPQIEWNNANVRWDPGKFRGIDKIFIPSSQQWVPDVVSYRHSGMETAFESKVVIFHTGYHVWVPHVFSTIFCEDVPDGPKYPRDQKVCILKLGSWVYDQSKINLTLKSKVEKPLDSLAMTPLESSGWKFKAISQGLQVKKYDCCPDLYSSIITNITIERKDTYFSLAVSVPGVVGGLTVALLYLVPPSSSARLISQMVCLLILVFIGVMDIRVMGSSVVMAPAAHYFMAAMVLDLLAIFWTVLTSAIWLNGSARPSNGHGALDSILSKLACICCLPSGPVDQDHQQLHMGDKTEGESRLRLFGLSSGQRLILVLDRLFCLINFVLLLFLFIYLGA